jgi:serine/threonine-protein kinase
MTGDFELHGTDRMLPFFGDELSGEARRKDVRALGALLFLLLTGTRPDVKTLRAQGTGVENPVLQLRPTAPLALAEVAAQALELGGTRVFGTAAQVRNALTTFLWGNRGDLSMPGSATITGMPARLAVMPKQAATMTVATLIAPSNEPSARPAAKSWRRHAIAAGVGLAAVLLLAGIWTRGQFADGRGAAAVAPATATPSPAAVSAAAVPVVSASVSGSAASAPADYAAVGSPRPAPAVARSTTARETAVRTGATGAQGIVALAVTPWGSVYVNGDARGTTPPLTQLTLPAGRHTIEIRNGDQAPYLAQVDITPERPQQIRHRFQ